MEDTRNKKTKLQLQKIDGFPISTRFSIDNFQQAIAFKPRHDIFIAGYPKSGTTWTQYIVWAIVNKGAPLPNVNDMWLKEVPHLEMSGVRGLESLKSPRLLKVNLPFNLTPYHISTKYIYIYRNPWDSCISGFNMLTQVDDNFTNGTFVDYFEYFIQGEVPFGDYFDHLLSWYTRWNDSNFLFLTYEEMKRETRKIVLKIARFLGENYHEMLTINEEILDNILQQIKFDEMKQNLSLEISTKSSYSDLPDDEVAKKKINFFHSGEIGQWNNYFTENQKRRLKQKFHEKLSGTEMLSKWKDSDVFPG